MYMSIYMYTCIFFLIPVWLVRYAHGFHVHVCIIKYSIWDFNSQRDKYFLGWGVDGGEGGAGDLFPPTLKDTMYIQ